MTHTAVQHWLDAYPGSYLWRAAGPRQQSGTQPQPYITHTQPSHRCDLSLQRGDKARQTLKDMPMRQLFNWPKVLSECE